MESFLFGDDGRGGYFFPDGDQRGDVGGRFFVFVVQSIGSYFDVIAIVCEGVGRGIIV